MTKRGFALFLSPLFVAGCAGTTIVTSGERPIIDTGEIMELLMDPIYEDLKDAVENPPEKRADWRALYVSAYTLAETNNLLYSRSDHAYMFEMEWRDRVDKSRAATAALAQSIQEQADYEAIKQNYLAVVESCNSCHRRYDPEERDAPKIDPPRSWMSKDTESGGAGLIQM